METLEQVIESRDRLRDDLNRTVAANNVEILELREQVRELRSELREARASINRMNQ